MIINNSIVNKLAIKFLFLLITAILFFDAIYNIREEGVNRLLPVILQSFVLFICLIYFVKYSLDLHEYQGLILGISSGSALLAIPLWAYAALKIGKRNSWMASMTLLIIGFLIFYYSPINSLNELLLILGFIGIGNGATGVLFWSMLPDTIEYGEWKTGVRTESSLYGFMTFAQKAAIALAALLLGLVLTQIGFEPNTVQSEQTLQELKFIMTWIPLTGIFLSFILVSFYPINKTFHQKLIFEIERKKLNHETN